MDKVFVFHIALIFIFALIFIVMWEFFSAPDEFMFVCAYILLMLMLMTDALLRRVKTSW